MDDCPRQSDGAVLHHAACDVCRRFEEGHYARNHKVDHRAFPPRAVDGADDVVVLLKNALRRANRRFRLHFLKRHVAQDFDLASVYALRIGDFRSQTLDDGQILRVALLPERTVAHLHGKIHDVLVGLQPFVVEGAVVAVQVKAASVAGVHVRHEIVHHRLSDLAVKRFPACRPLRAVWRVRRSVARPLGDKRPFNRAADLLARQLQRANENVAGNVLDPRLRSG